MLASATPSAFLRPLLALLVALAVVAPATAQAADPVVAAVGDIACGGDTASTADCRDAATAEVAAGMNPDLVLPLGDIQYENGQYAYFQQYYDKTWGRFKSISRPVAGNHEYGTPGAKGYFDYYNGVDVADGPAGNRTKGYYSYNVGSWHMIALNSNCSQVGGCSVGSAQERWLRADLAANTAPCTLAYWHHPRWSSDVHELGTTTVSPLVQALYESSVDLLLVGHAHLYERYAPQTPSGVMDSANGLTQFLVGTGGRSEVAFAGTYQPNSLARSTDFGVLKLGLHGDYYDYEFRPIAGQTFRDSGAKTCHRTPTDQRRILTFAPTGDATVRADKPAANFGKENSLQADSKPKAESYLKFAVDGLAGAKVERAKLRFYASGGSKSGGTVSRVASTTWTEGTINWNNRPARGTALGSLGAVTAGRWYEVDVTPHVTSDGAVSLALSSASSDAVAYASLEGGAATAPQLVITAAPGDTEAPSVPATPTARASGPTRVELSWPAAPDNVATTGYRIYRNGTAIATSATTTYADTTVSPTTAYSYAVTAYDAAGNESARSSAVSVTTPAASTATTLTFAPTDDTYVTQAFPASNFGGDPTTIYDGDPVRRVLLKFAVSNVPSTGVARAVLRLRAENESVFGGSVRRLTETSWSEGTVTWNDQPAASSTTLGQIGTTVYNGTYEVDVTDAVTGNGTVALRLDSTNADGGGYWSKESPLTSTGASKAASLIVTTK